MNAADPWPWLLRGESDAVTGSDENRLEAVMGLVVRTVPGAVACSITELDGGTYRTSVASSPAALELDLAQYTSGDGPCMTAARDRQRQLVRDTSGRTRYPGFAAAAARHDIGSSLSVPVRIGRLPAALNIYSRATDGFTDRGAAVADLLGRALGARFADAVSRPLTMSEAMLVERRSTLVLQAQDAVAAAGVSASQAFGSLARRSAQERRSIFDVATDLTASPRV